MELIELPDEIYEQIEALSEAGNECSDEEDHEGAIGNWQQALSLLPEPHQDWEAATWLYASLGDAYCQSGQYELSKDASFNALNCPDGQDNPFIYYTLGKALLRLDDEQAVDALLRAYMLDGTDIFDTDGEEGEECLQVLADRGLLEEH